MDTRKYILRQTGWIALGQALCIAVMFGIFFLLHTFDRTVLLGGILGGVMAIANFFFMAVGAGIAKSGFCNPIALVVPLIFTRPILTVGEFFRKSGDSKS